MLFLTGFCLRASVGSGLRFYIGWLHAKAGHNLECQLAFNAMFGVGLGRLFGEGIEQLWVGGRKGREGVGMLV